SLGWCRGFGFFLDALAGFLGRLLVGEALGLFLGPAIFLGAALFFLAGLLGLAVLATARFLERGHPVLFGLAQQPVLHLAARGSVVGRLGGGLRLLRSGRRRRLGLGCGSGGLGRGLGRLDLSGPAQHAPLLHLDHHGVRTPVAEA